MASLVDQYNLMSYGQGGVYPGWKTWFFSAITGETPATPTSLKSSIDAYARAGVPRSKLGIGIGFYGMNYSAAARRGLRPRAIPRVPTRCGGTSVYRSIRPCISGSTRTRGDRGGASRTGRAGGTTWTTWGRAGPSPRSVPRDCSRTIPTGRTVRSPGGTFAAGKYRWDEVAQQGYLLFPDGFQPSPDGSTTLRAGRVPHLRGRALDRGQGALGAGRASAGPSSGPSTTASSIPGPGANPLLAAVKRAFLQ